MEEMDGKDAGMRHRVFVVGDHLWPPWQISCHSDRVYCGSNRSLNLEVNGLEDPWTPMLQSFSNVSGLKI